MNFAAYWQLECIQNRGYLQIQYQSNIIQNPKSIINLEISISKKNHMLVSNNTNYITLNRREDDNSIFAPIQKSYENEITFISIYIIVTS